MSHMPNLFRVEIFFLDFVPRVVASSNPGLQLANAFGVICPSYFGVRPPAFLFPSFKKTYSAPTELHFFASQDEIAVSIRDGWNEKVLARVIPRLT